MPVCKISPSVVVAVATASAHDPLLLLLPMKQRRQFFWCLSVLPVQLTPVAFLNAFGGGLQFLVLSVLLSWSVSAVDPSSHLP